MEEFLLPCLNKQIFGLDCYGCGGQRALLMVINGEFYSAFKMFPAIYPLLILLGFVLVNLFVKFKTDYIIKISLIIITGGVMLINYFIKIFNILT
ncbi:DUF2752 domain-containing protein [soil metagenome]